MKDLLESKKFRTMLIGLVASLLVALFGNAAGMEEETARQIAQVIVILCASYIGAQGLADLGKEAQKERQNGKKNGG